MLTDVVEKILSLVSLFPIDGARSYMPKGKSTWKPICVFTGKENNWLNQGDVIMNMIFEACCRHEGRGFNWYIGKTKRVAFHLNGSLIVLSSNSIPLVYLLGSKGGSGKTRAAMEYISSSDRYGTRFRQHEVILHDQMEFQERYEDQIEGEFGDEAKDQPQTRAPTCVNAFETFK